MTRIVVMAPFAEEFFGGRQELELAAATIFALVDQLDRIAPDFADEAAIRCAFAIDGVLTGDWSTAIPEGAEVLLFPRIGGG